jgi:hypothetical protein
VFGAGEIVGLNEPLDGAQLPNSEMVEQAQAQGQEQEQEEERTASATESTLERGLGALVV